MRRVTALALAGALVCLAPVSVVVARQDAPGQVTGVVQDVNERPAANVLVQLRNLDTGVLVDTTATNSGGGFAFTGVLPGHYVVEVVDATARVLATSPALTLIAGEGLRGILVTLPTSKPGTFVAFFTSTTGVVVAAATGAGIGFAVYEATKSKSR